MGIKRLNNCQKANKNIQKIRWLLLKTENENKKFYKTCFERLREKVRWNQHLGIEALISVSIFSNSQTIILKNHSICLLFFLKGINSLCVIVFFRPNYEKLFDHGEKDLSVAKIKNMNLFSLFSNILCFSSGIHSR